MDHLVVECVEKDGVAPVLLGLLYLVQVYHHAGPGRGLSRHDARVDRGVVPLLLSCKGILTTEIKHKEGFGYGYF